MGIVVVSTIPVFYGYDWPTWIGWPLAVALVVLNKVRAVRRRRAETSRHFD